MQFCACGQPLHYSDPMVRYMTERLIAALGKEVEVRFGNRAWMVPRHFHALHGVPPAFAPVEEMEQIAKQYGFREVTPEQRAA